MRKLSVTSIASSFAKRAGGLKQRMSLENSFQQSALGRTPADVTEAGLMINCDNRQRGLENQKSRPAPRKRSWTLQEVSSHADKRNGRSAYGLRGIFS
jgi:hypothetical protein